MTFCGQISAKEREKRRERAHKSQSSNPCADRSGWGQGLMRLCVRDHFNPSLNLALFFTTSNAEIIISLSFKWKSPWWSISSCASANQMPASRYFAAAHDLRLGSRLPGSSCTCRPWSWWLLALRWTRLAAAAAAGAERWGRRGRRNRSRRRRRRWASRTWWSWSVLHLHAQIKFDSKVLVNYIISFRSKIMVDHICRIPVIFSLPPFPVSRQPSVTRFFSGLWSVNVIRLKRRSLISRLRNRREGGKHVTANHVTLCTQRDISALDR